ncbi:RepA leader peptide Tap [Escherichia coli]
MPGKIQDLFLCSLLLRIVSCWMVWLSFNKRITAR